MSGLKLLAQDDEDLKIISAHLQDAIMRVGDMVYLPRRRRFVAVMNRFCWEDCGEHQAGRARSGGTAFRQRTEGAVARRAAGRSRRCRGPARRKFHTGCQWRRQYRSGALRWRFDPAHGRMYRCLPERLDRTASRGCPTGTQSGSLRQAENGHDAAPECRHPDSSRNSRPRGGTPRSGTDVADTVLPSSPKCAAWRCGADRLFPAV